MYTAQKRLNKSERNIMWNYEIHDNFLDPNDLSEITSSVSDINVEKEGIEIFQNLISVKNRSIIRADCLDDQLIHSLCERYYESAQEILQKLAPQKCSLITMCQFYIVITGQDYSYPIHDDDAEKLLSGVIYIAPESNAGTFMYESNSGLGKKEVEWKVNRAFFFSRIGGQTWHSYRGDGVSPRVCLVFNLMTDNVLEVLRAEGVAYPHFSAFLYYLSKYKNRYRSTLKNIWVRLLVLFRNKPIT